MNATFNHLLNKYLVGLIALGCWCLPSFVFAKTSLEPDNYPRVANYFLGATITHEEAEALAQWDLIILGMENIYTSGDAVKLIKQHNPKVIILAYVASEEVPTEHLSITDAANPLYQLYHPFTENDHWFLKDSQGNYLNFWPGTRLINLSGDWKTTLPDFMTNQVLGQSKLWDGVFYDNCFNDISWVNSDIDMNLDGTPDGSTTVDQQWKDGMTTIMRRTQQLNPDKLIVCNSNGKYYTYIHGRLVEEFPPQDEGWNGAMKNYFKVLRTARRPSIVILNTGADETKARDYRNMRFNLTSALLGGGFASFDESLERHRALWWYDEYDAALGMPLGKGYNILKPSQTTDNIGTGMWRRNFANGIVLLNTTNQNQKVRLEEGFEKILGTQDTTVNNGKVVGSVTVPPNDGIILRGRITQVNDAPFINGSFAKVFDAGGKVKRNNFFSYNSNFFGGSTVHNVTKDNVTVVGDATYINIYSGTKRLTRFAPYGTGFSGGINFTVTQLTPKNKTLNIITAPKQGAQPLKMFGLTGKQLNAGCFPFGAGFSNGMNVSAGDVLKRSRGTEVVVSPAGKGAPEVRLVNKQCQVLKRRFMVYDKKMQSGLAVAVGDIDNNGRAEIVTVPGKGGAPYVKVFNGRGKLLRPGFYAFNKADRNGSSVTVSDIDADGFNDLVVTSFNIFQ